MCYVIIALCDMSICGINVVLIANLLNVIYDYLGLRAITSLLCCTMLRPRMGDPTSSVLMHFHRNNEMIFLGSR